MGAALPGVEMFPHSSKNMCLTSSGDFTNTNNIFCLDRKKIDKIKISKYKFVFGKLLVLNLCVTIFQVPTPNRSLFVQLSVLDPLDFCQIPGDALVQHQLPVLSHHTKA